MCQQKKRFVFIAPQGTLVLKNNYYGKRQGATAEEGGQVIYVIELAKALTRLGCEVDIFSRHYGNKYYNSKDVCVEAHPHYPGMRIIHVPTAAPSHIEKEHFYPYYLEYLARMERFIEQENLYYDQIIGHYADGMFMAMMLASYFECEKKTPVAAIGITHSLGSEKAEGLLRKFKKDRPFASRAELAATARQAAQELNINARLGCELAALSFMDGVGSVSPLHTRYLAKRYCYPENQIAFLPGGVDISVFYRMADGSDRQLLRRILLDKLEINDKTRRGLLTGKIIFGFGRRISIKGIYEAVQSMAYLMETPEGKDAYYVYAGGNNPPRSEEECTLISKCMNYARKHGYADRILFVGGKSQKDINRWLNASNIYLHAAHLEPWGLAPAEAAAAGIPVVISKHAGASSFLEHELYARHVDPCNPRDIAEQIRLYLEDPIKALEIAGRAADLVKNNATWDATAQKLVDFSAEVAGKYLPKRKERKKIANPYAAEAKALLLGCGTGGFQAAKDWL